MKKFITISLLTIGLLAVVGYYLYHTVMPGIIAHAVVSDTVPGFIPKRLKSKVEEIRTPINKGTEAIIEKMHAEEIPLRDVLSAVDKVTEEQAYEFLDEVNAAKPASTNEVFDLAKKHFPTQFDPEVFREPFNEHFQMEQIKDAIVYANLNRKSKDVDITTAKAIIKKIIVEKEKEMESSSKLKVKK